MAVTLESWTDNFPNFDRPRAELREVEGQSWLNPNLKPKSAGFCVSGEDTLKTIHWGAGRFTSRQSLAGFIVYPEPMTTSETEAYPGASATPFAIIALADEYAIAAKELMERGRPKEPLSRMPGRLGAMHAIELYLNAFLISQGTTNREIRAHVHDLAGRTDRAVAAGLVLRKRTKEHLKKMTDGWEYLVSRYVPEWADGLSELNRLEATLEQVANKVRASTCPIEVTAEKPLVAGT